MPDSKTEKKPKKSKQSKEGAQLDIVFSGPLLFVPAVKDGNVTGVEVYSPLNDHPVGAVFVPGVWFSDAELQDPHCERWPEPENFTLLDPHSYAINLTQDSFGNGGSRSLAVSSIPDTNHKVKPGRKLSHDWHVQFTINGNLSTWASPCLADVTEGLFHGSDSPASSKVALAHRLTYAQVTGAEFAGISLHAKEYLKANISKGGTLIIEGELPYQSTLLHERKAVDAMAKLAGLDLRLMANAPTPSPSKVTGHLMPCLSSVILA